MAWVSCWNLVGSSGLVEKSVRWELSDRGGTKDYIEPRLETRQLTYPLISKLLAISTRAMIVVSAGDRDVPCSEIGDREGSMEAGSFRLGRWWRSRSAS